MKEKKDKIKKLAETMLVSDGNYYGVRKLQEDENYEIGDIARVSFDWDYANDCRSNVKLNGTCAIGIDVDDDDQEFEIEYAIKYVTEKYHGKQIAILKAETIDGGNDPGEVVMHNAEVIEILYLQ